MVTRIIQKRGAGSAKNVDIKEAEFFYATNEKKVYVGTAVGTTAGMVMDSAVGDSIASLVDGKIPVEQLPDSINKVTSKSTIAERDAIVESERYDSMRVMVFDASADVTVDGGWAIYAWDLNNLQWIKIQEQESLDVLLTWDAIQDKPNSSVIDIDSVVSLIKEKQAIISSTTAAFTTAIKAKLDGASIQLQGTVTGTATMAADGKMIVDTTIDEIDGGVVS